VSCGVVSAAALTVRVQQRISERGFGSSLRGNVADVSLSTLSFGLLGTPAAAAFGEGPAWLSEAFGVTRSVDGAGVGPFVGRLFLAGPDVGSLVVDILGNQCG
jgi:hypothetical protein